MRYSIVALFVLAVPGYGQNFWGATEWTQVANNFQLAYMAGMHLKEYTDMLRHGVPVGQLPWTNIAADITALDQAGRYGIGLSSRLGNADREFQRQFPGVDDETSPEGKRRNFAASYRQWSRVVMDTLIAQQRHGSRQHDQILGEITILDQLRIKAMGTEGRLEAIQAAAAIGAEVPRQLIKLRDLMQQDNDSRAAIMGMQQQQEARTVAAETWFFQHQDKPATGNKTEAFQ